MASLYGETFESLAPRREHLAEIDVLVVDLQDVGSRYYTYVWTMVLAMEAAFAAGVAVVVLDRPNPLGGVAVEGGSVAESCRSFVGLGPVPVRHGLTIGEMARLRAAGMAWAGDSRFARPLSGDLTVVPMRGWRRDMTFADTGLPWVMPSPNMPTPDTALVYPGQCLFEATNLSEGRGTTRPFEVVGAPFLDGYAWAAAAVSIARRPPAAAVVPADVSQVRRPLVRRRAAARHRSGRLPSLRDGPRPDRGGAPAGAGRVPLADGALRVRRRSAGHRSADRRRRRARAPWTPGRPLEDVLAAVRAVRARRSPSARRAGA